MLLSATVAQMAENSRAIGLEVSLDAKNFALARFPPNMQLENQVSTCNFPNLL